MTAALHNPRLRSWLALVVFVLGVASVAAVVAWHASGSQPDADDLEFRQQLFAVVQGDSQVPLSSLTNFTWDTVSVFGEYPSREAVLAETGRDLLESDRPSVDGLFVFCKDGEVVATRFASTIGMFFSGLETYSSDVLVGPIKEEVLPSFFDPTQAPVAAECSP